MILDQPKLYGTAKDTVTLENLIDLINSSIHALGWKWPMITSARPCIPMPKIESNFNQHGISSNRYSKSGLAIKWMLPRLELCLTT